MFTSANLVVILFSLPIYQLLYFTIQLISFKKNNPPGKYLGLLLLSMTGFLVINALYYSANETLMVWLYFIFVPLLLTLPPLYFLYLLSVVKKKNHIGQFSKFSLFIPSILILILNLVTYGLSPGHQRLLFLKTDHTLLSIPFSALDNSIMVFWAGTGLLLYTQLSWVTYKTVKLLKTEKAVMHASPSHLPYLQFKWVYIMSLSLLVFAVTASAQLLTFNTQTGASSFVFNLVFLFSSGLAGYFATKQDELFTHVSRVGMIKAPEKTPGMNNPVLTRMEVKKGIPDDRAGEIIRKIEMHLQQDKPYLDKQFSINDLSRQTGISRNRLTFVINEVMEKNFYGLVNDYRVRETIELMRTNGKNYTMDAVAEMSGFQSRSSFYACFKKYTGQTPREFASTLKMKDNSDTK